MIQGAKSLKMWIDRENDKAWKESLQNTYNILLKEIESNLKWLEEKKKKIVITEGNDGQQMKKKTGGKGEGGKDDNKEKDEEGEKFKQALNEAIVTDKPNVKWEDIAGLEQAKKALQEAVILPIKFPKIFEGARKPWKGILLYGPPGTGKTFLAKACATEASGTFFSVSSSDLLSKYVGESEKLIKTLFKLAREKKPSIIFIDEIDSLCGARTEGENEASRRVKTEFLVQMQGVGKDDFGFLVLGATNLPWAIDSAIRRRFEKRIYIPLPDVQARKFMVKHNLKGTPCDLTDEQYQKLAEGTDGFSGSDISTLDRDAMLEPVRLLQCTNAFLPINKEGKTFYLPVEENRVNEPGIKKMSYLDINQDQLEIPRISYSDFEKALKKTKPSVSKDQLKEYVDFTTKFGQDG